jgi:hypothetical protein
MYEDKYFNLDSGRFLTELSNLTYNFGEMQSYVFKKDSAASGLDNFYKSQLKDGIPAIEEKIRALKKMLKQLNICREDIVSITSQTDTELQKYFVNMIQSSNMRIKEAEEIIGDIVNVLTYKNN